MLPPLSNVITQYRLPALTAIPRIPNFLHICQADSYADPARFLTQFYTKLSEFWQFLKFYRKIVDYWIILQIYIPKEEYNCVMEKMVSSVWVILSNKNTERIRGGAEDRW